MANTRLLIQALILGLLLPLLVSCGQPDQPTIGLYRAIQVGDLDQIERHIAWKTDINQVTPDGEVPLHAAARQGRWVVVRLLLDNGAEINARDRDGHAPVYLALMQGRTQVAELLIRRGAAFSPDTLLLEAARNRISDRDVYRLLLGRGADINARDPAGDTPLHIAVRNGYRVVAKQLIRHGADVNLPDSAGRVPLHLAANRGDTDIERLLKKNGATLGPANP